MNRIKITLAIVLAAMSIGSWAEKWTFNHFVDEFDGTEGWMATSPIVHGTPYRWSVLNVHCTSDILSVGTAYGYLNRSQRESGVNHDKPIKVKMMPAFSAREGKTEKEIFDVRVRGGTRIYVWSDPESYYTLVDRLMESTEVATRFSYFQEQGVVTINYDMTGAKDAISKVVEACKNR